VKLSIGTARPNHARVKVPHDLPSLQKFCSSRFGWPAAKTLEVAQELYDGQGKKIITYPAQRSVTCRRA
jgi:DNA topoisomerase-3